MKKYQAKFVRLYYHPTFPPVITLNVDADDILSAQRIVFQKIRHIVGTNVHKYYIGGNVFCMENDKWA